MNRNFTYGMFGVNIIWCETYLTCSGLGKFFELGSLPYSQSPTSNMHLSCPAGQIPSKMWASSHGPPANHVPTAGVMSPLSTPPLDTRVKLRLSLRPHLPQVFAHRGVETRTLQSRQREGRVVQCGLLVCIGCRLTTVGIVPCKHCG